MYFRTLLPGNANYLYWWFGEDSVQRSSSPLNQYNILNIEYLAQSSWIQHICICIYLFFVQLSYELFRNPSGQLMAKEWMNGSKFVRICLARHYHWTDYILCSYNFIGISRNRGKWESMPRADPTTTDSRWGDRIRLVGRIPSRRQYPFVSVCAVCLPCGICIFWMFAGDSWHVLQKIAGKTRRKTLSMIVWGSHAAQSLDDLFIVLHVFCARSAAVVVKQLSQRVGIHTNFMFYPTPWRKSPRG